MRIILLGAPGAGKGTQSQFITKKYGIPQISTGEMLRSAVESSSNVGKLVKNVINSGKLVTDQLITTLVEKRIAQKDCHSGFLLDGFPRTIPQANYLKKLGIDIDYVLEFALPEEMIFDRITGRRIHKPSGLIYHIKFNYPKIINKDNVKEDFITRTDDQKEIVHKRVLEYHQLTTPLISLYKRESEQGNIKYFKINAAKTVLEVSKELENILG